jgi:hypothetical protein
MKKLIEKAYILSSIAFIGWFTISLADVVTHQGCGGTDASWNLFVMFLKMTGCM